MNNLVRNHTYTTVQGIGQSLVLSPRSRPLGQPFSIRQLLDFPAYCCCVRQQLGGQAGHHSAGRRRRWSFAFRVRAFSDHRNVPGRAGPRARSSIPQCRRRRVPAESSRSLLDALRGIEDRSGRMRSRVGAPRTLDLDLILAGDDVIEEPDLRVPHPRFRERQFVLEPLAAIAPDLRDPVTGRSIEDLWQRLREGKPAVVPAKKGLKARASSPDTSRQLTVRWLSCTSFLTDRGRPCGRSSACPSSDQVWVCSPRSVFVVMTSLLPSHLAVALASSGPSCLSALGAVELVGRGHRAVRPCARSTSGHAVCLTVIGPPPCRGRRHRRHRRRRRVGLPPARPGVHVPEKSGFCA